MYSENLMTKYKKNKNKERNAKYSHIYLSYNYPSSRFLQIKVYQVWYRIRSFICAQYGISNRETICKVLE